MTAALAHDREGPLGTETVVLLHAGIADRRMWDPVWPELTAERDTIRLDLRGFGDSWELPDESLDPVDDVLGTLAGIGVDRFHLVGCSFGAGVAVEVALTRPEAVASLLLAAPGGSLLSDVTSTLRAFFAAETEALEAGDLDVAVAANVDTWVGSADPGVRDLVATMQRRAFEVTADWDDVEEAELDPPALERLREIRIPTLVLLGASDLDAIRLAAARVVRDVPGAQLVQWDDTQHLPPLERPDDFLALLRGFLPAV